MNSAEGHVVYFHILRWSILTLKQPNETDANFSLPVLGRAVLGRPVLRPCSELDRSTIYFSLIFVRKNGAFGAGLYYGSFCQTLQIWMPWRYHIWRTSHEATLKPSFDAQTVSKLKVALEKTWNNFLQLQLTTLSRLLDYYGRTLSERPCYILPMFFFFLFLCAP